MKYLSLLFILIPIHLSAQTFSGKVINTEGEAIISANIYWEGTTIGTTTDEDGYFDIPDIEHPALLIASYVGYTPDTLEILQQPFVAFRLNKVGYIEEIVVEGEQDGIVISGAKAIKTEQINSLELKKAACCDLAGCFETQLTVQPQTTNVITNSKELSILGLSGVYNQVLVDGFPMIQGLSYTYGISNIQGPLVENIFVAKGANSVLQGYESISGQINVTSVNTDKAKTLFLNAYLNSFAEKQFNANYAILKEKWNNLLAVHTAQPGGSFDRDKDSFLDVPKTTRYSIFNKWQYGNALENGWNSRTSIRFVNEKRLGGQTSFDEDKHKGSQDVYGQIIHINQPEISTKTGYRFNGQHSIYWFASSFYQKQNAYFGTLQYDATQTNIYTKLQHEWEYSLNNSLKSGISFRHLDLSEDIQFLEDNPNRNYHGNYHKLENIPGVFTEHSMNILNNKITWMLGARLDIHNDFGAKFTPRTLLKYSPNSKLDIRTNIGKGWRTANVFSENIQLLASSRDIIFTEKISPEEAINYGINATQKFETEKISGYVSADYYATHFQNQFFPDYDTDPTKAFIKNYRDKSVANGFQIESFIQLDPVSFKIGYNYLEVYRKIDNRKYVLPFIQKHKIITTLSYQTPKENFQADLNLHWHSKQDLPNTSTLPNEYQRPNQSEPYVLMNAQLTYLFPHLEIYGGCENILNFRQNRPIIGWQDPFGDYFDTSSVWGPTKGREFYMGVRYYLD